MKSHRENYESYPQWLSQEAITTLEKGYLLRGGDQLMSGQILGEDETPKSAYERVANRVGEIYPELNIGDDLFHCLHSGWIGLATPVYSNFGAKRGLPISCFLVHVGDSIEEIYLGKLTVAQMSKHGGGTAAYFGDLRPEGSPISGGGTSSNVRSWVKEYDLTASTVTQGNVRRGSIAAYLPIEHPDVADVLRSKDHAHGDPRNFIDCNLGVTISNEFMEQMINGDREKLKLFCDVISLRLKTGSPYLVFIDHVNEANPPGYVKNGLTVSMSNLCSEIMLHTSPKYSAVCCLSSMNLARWDEYENWKGVSGFTAVELAIILLDAVLEEFITKAKDIIGMESAVAFSKKSRALGLGVFGLCAYYQMKGLPFESEEAEHINQQLFKSIHGQALAASKFLGTIYGVPEWCDDRRNSHLIAIAPTRTNSVIAGAYSAGVEPVESNYYCAKQSKGTFTRKNPLLEGIINSRVERTSDRDTIWDSILKNGGSIAHLKYLFSEKELEVFKTAREIDQFKIIKQAAQRQKYVCQSQSINLFVDETIDAETLFDIHLYAWMVGLKSLYYLKGKSLIVNRAAIDEPLYSIITKDDCIYCQMLKDQLRSENKDFKEISLDDAKASGIWNDDWKTVPQLFHSGVRIGGYSTYMNSETSHECTSCEG